MSHPTARDHSHEVNLPRASFALESSLPLGRRDFIKMFGSGMAVVFLAGRTLAQEGPGGTTLRVPTGRELPTELKSWLHINAAGEVTVFTGKMEVGQNARTALTQIVAEELLVPMAAIRLVMGDTDLVPYDVGTFSSLTVPEMGPQLRKVAATAREALLELAAAKWGVDRSTLVVANGKIAEPRSGRSITFGALTEGKTMVKTISKDTPTIPPSEWKVAGSTVPKVDGRDFVTGKHRYASDFKLPGMLHGKVLRPGGFGATLVSLDAKAAEALPGVTVVHEGDFVGVTAPEAQLASEALAALGSEWKTKAQISEKELYPHLRSQGGDAPSSGILPKGEVSAGGHTLQQTYTIAYIAHAPLEPRAAVAEWKDDKLTVWAGTQRPFGFRSDLAKAFNIPEQQVRVVVPDTGSAYGGKHTGEVAIEVARLAKASGKPVKLVWTREEEFTWAYFRPAGVIEVASQVSNDGRITAWGFHNYNSGPAAIEAPYDIPGQKTKFHRVEYPLRQGPYRGLAATANHFARESHLDDLARIVRIDPLEFRLKNIKDPRLRAVLETAAQTFEWGKHEAKPDHGYGLAAGYEKGSYVATCVEVVVARATREVRVLRVVQAFECGAIINPDQLKNQNEGGIMMALGGALLEEIHFADGKILNPHFAQYRVPRFTDLPKIELCLLDRKDIAPAGAGETPLLALAPAVGNAICAATGIRPKALPMLPSVLKG